MCEQQFNGFSFSPTQVATRKYRDTSMARVSKHRQFGFLVYIRSPYNITAMNDGLLSYTKQISAIGQATTKLLRYFSSIAKHHAR